MFIDLSLLASDILQLATDCLTLTAATMDSLSNYDNDDNKLMK